LLLACAHTRSPRSPHEAASIGNRPLSIPTRQSTEAVKAETAGVKAEKAKAAGKPEQEGAQTESTGKTNNGRGSAKWMEKLQARIGRFEAKLETMKEKGHTPAGLSQAVERFRTNGERFTASNTPDSPPGRPAAPKSDLGAG
jgi:hypothetical protein